MRHREISTLSDRLLAALYGCVAGGLGGLIAGIIGVVAGLFNVGEDFVFYSAFADLTVVLLASTFFGSLPVAFCQGLF